MAVELERQSDLSFDVDLWSRVRHRLYIEGVDGSSGGDVLPPDRCWRWLGSWDAHGIPRVGLRAEWLPVHRALYAAFVHPIPAGHHLMPREGACSDEWCVNPLHRIPLPKSAHLSGASAVNVTKTHCKRGHELTPENVLYLAGKHGARRSCRACKRLRRRRAQIATSGADRRRVAR
jgi:hypothetical protein